MAWIRNGLRSVTLLQQCAVRVEVTQLNSALVGRGVHTCASLQKQFFQEPTHWMTYNDVVYKPRAEGEPLRPAEIVHQRCNIKYSYKKLWYIASMIRGMSIDEAMKQLSFYERKGAVSVKETLLEAQEIAVQDHNVEYKSNLWIADSFVGKAHTVKGLRKHARGRYNILLYRYTHYFVRLREGRPPEHYYAPPMTGNDKMEDYLTSLRERRIRGTI